MVSIVKALNQQHHHLMEGQSSKKTQDVFLITYAVLCQALLSFSGVQYTIWGTKPGSVTQCCHSKAGQTPSMQQKRQLSSETNRNAVNVRPLKCKAALNEPLADLLFVKAKLLKTMCHCYSSVILKLYHYLVQLFISVVKFTLPPEKKI